VSVEAREVMAVWNKPQPMKDFYGATLGYFESINRNTGEMAIIEAIVDFTHRRFVFIPYRGDEAQKMKKAIDKAITPPDVGSCAILWTWAKGKQMSRRNLLYHVTQLPNYGLFLSICELWQLCLQYGETYKDRAVPKLPKHWKSRLKFLEEECKLLNRQGGLVCISS